MPVLHESNLTKTCDSYTSERDTIEPFYFAVDLLTRLLKRLPRYRIKV